MASGALRGTLGRVAASVGILAASLAISSIIVQRRNHPVPAPASASAVRPIRTVLAPKPVEPLPPAGDPLRAEPKPLPKPEPPQPEVAAEDPLSDALCRKGMLLVDGTTCADPKRRCEEQDPANSRVCRRFAPAKCRSGLALRFCIDGSEYPNIPGMTPAVMLTFRQAEDACEAEGKRLCTEAEWTFACEGPLALSFSYGDEINPGACNVGHESPRIPPEQLWEARNVAAIVERVDARVASASQAGCVSPFGARDLVGNVEEWVRSDIPGFAGALRGGSYSGPASCRTVRQMHEPGFRQFHTGFRCCEAPRVPAKSRPSIPPGRGSGRPGLVAPHAGFD
jgi:hypothetical protein